VARHVQALGPHRRGFDRVTTSTGPIFGETASAISNGVKRALEKTLLKLSGIAGILPECMCLYFVEVG